MPGVIYDPSYHPEKARELAASKGLAGSDLARALDISASTHYKWRQIHTEYARAVDQGKMKFRTNVAEDSLLKKIRGYHHDEIYYKWEDNGRGSLKRVKQKTVRKYVGPDVNAIMAWLRAHYPEVYGDKQQPRDRREKELQDILRKISEKSGGKPPLSVAGGKEA